MTTLQFQPPRLVSPFAEDPARSRGRLVPEPPSPTRTEFQRDRDRIIHSTAFRRLADKTQVFVLQEDDHCRTRLTHTIEVSQIARALARALGLDGDLAEALALAHDMGHAPFGHTGEDALAACMADHGGFDHNAQALRVVTTLERRYAGFDGLNLAWETLEGLVKHNGPLLARDGTPTPRWAQGLPEMIRDYDARHPLDLASYAGAEAQAAAVADDIAYNAHDIDDGLRTGLFAIEALREIPYLDTLLDEVHAAHPGLDGSRLAYEFSRRLITRFVEDVIGESERRLVRLQPPDAAAVRAAPDSVVAFSAPVAAANSTIKDLLFRIMYRHPRVIADREIADRLVRDCFAAFMDDPMLMPPEWRAVADTFDVRLRARAVADYLAGMTDRYAVRLYGRLFGRLPFARTAGLRPS